MVIHDAICVLMLSHPDWFHCEEHRVSICLDEGEHLGQTVVAPDGATNCTVAMDADAEKVNGYLAEFARELAK